MGKPKIDETITTLQDFYYATANEGQSIQIYVLHEDSLWEITEVMKILPKNEELKPYIVLRVR